MNRKASNQEILAALFDETGAITAGFNQAYNAAMLLSDIDNATTISAVDSHRDHTSGSFRFHNQVEQLQYNSTWQHGRNTSTSRCDLRFGGVDLSTRSTNRIDLDEYDDVVTRHTHNKDYIHTYVDLTDKVRSHEYYQNDPGAIQEKGLQGPTSEYAHTDKGRYINNDMEMSHTQNDSHPHIYINDTERIESSRINTTS